MYRSETGQIPLCFVANCSETGQFAVRFAVDFIVTEQVALNM